MAINYSAYYRLARLDKPVGIWLLLLPCWMGLGLAGSLDVGLYLLFALGAIVMRAAGCIINDMADREIDVHVTRTKNRPLASGELSMTQASVFLGILLIAGLLVLTNLPMIAVFVGLCSVPLFVTYPFMKRLTNWPQFFLGLTFNIGILIAYASVTKSLDFVAFVLYFGAVFWTLGYDTIYAHQDKSDDVLLGVKSTAVFLGEKSKFFISVFYGAFLLMVIWAIFLKTGFNAQSLLFFIFASSHFIWQVQKLDISSSGNCLHLFKSNVVAGLLICAALLSATAN